MSGLKRKYIDIARASHLLKDLPEELIRELLKRASIRRARRGETLHLQGEKAQMIHIVLDGWVKLYRIAANGNEAIIDVITRGGSYGETVALRPMTCLVSSEAVTDCTLLQIPSARFTRMIRRNPEIAISMIASNLHHLHMLIDQIEQIKAQSGAQRVAEFLLKLSNCDTGSCVVTLPYDKALIAGRLGMKPESLSRSFGTLREVGVRTTRNHAAIADIKKLRDYAEEDPASAWSKAL